MGKFEEIVSGWKNYVFPNEIVEAIAKKRITICLDKKQCKKLSDRNFCNICNCYMPAKVRSPKSTCPKNKWV